MIHTLKTAPAIWALVASGQKPWEVRVNDRNYQPGDTLILVDGKDLERGRRLAAKVVAVVDLSTWAIPRYDDDVEGEGLVGMTLEVLDEVPPPVEGWVWSTKEEATEARAWADEGICEARIDRNGEITVSLRGGPPTEEARALVDAVLARLLAKAYTKGDVRKAASMQVELG